jgi:transcriptional regulator with XRE-family HTH domain
MKPKNLPLFAAALERWLESHASITLRKLAMNAGVSDSDLSRVRSGTKGITRETLSRLLTSAYLDNADRLEFIRAFLRDEVPAGELREGETFQSHTDILFPRADIAVAQMSPLEEALNYFRNLAEKDPNAHNWLVTMRQLMR